jgi:hypothetical protein
VRVALGLVVGMLIALVIACGGAKSAAPVTGTMPPRVPDHVQTMPGENPEIAQLMADINRDLDQLQLEHVRPSEGTQMRTMSAGVEDPTASPTCPKPSTQTCKTNCDLTRSICDNARKICDIADGLKNDAWANGKCTDGKTSCDTAGKKCCGCQ